MEDFNDVEHTTPQRDEACFPAYQSEPSLLLFLLWHATYLLLSTFRTSLAY